MKKGKIKAVRGSLLWFTGNPFVTAQSDCVTYEEDGLLIIQDSHIQASGPAASLLPALDRDVSVEHYPDHIIMPGFIDAHTHYAQMQIIGAYGKQLLDWLNDYTFIAEQAFADGAHATAMADFFCQELLRRGTTTAAVYCTVHPQSVDALFEAATQRNMRMIGGKVMMDRNAPDALLDTPQLAYDQSKALIERWHEKGRNHYALTPRFAPCCSMEQLDMAGKLRGEFDRLYVQSHLSENEAEVNWAGELFPDRSGYLDVYNHHGLTGQYSLYGHAIHLTADEWQDVRDRGTGIVHCPTSNLFLGSGLFNLGVAMGGPDPVNLSIGTDVGAGTSLSMLTTLGEAYKVAHLKGYSLNAFQAFYLATLGGARALSLDHLIGSLEVGKEADFIVLDKRSTPLMAKRMDRVSSIEEALFVLMTMGDDRAIAATYIFGQKCHSRAEGQANE